MLARAVNTVSRDNLAKVCIVGDQAGGGHGKVLDDIRQRFEGLRRVVVKIQARALKEEAVMRGLIHCNRARSFFQHRVGVAAIMRQQAFAGSDQGRVEVVHLCRALLHHGVKNHVHGVVPRQLPGAGAQRLLKVFDPLRRAKAQEEQRVVPHVGVLFFFRAPANVKVRAPMAAADDAQQRGYVIGHILLDGKEALNNVVEPV